MTTKITMTFRTLNDSARVTVTGADKDACIRAAARKLLGIERSTKNCDIGCMPTAATVYQITTPCRYGGRTIEGSICEC